MCLLRFHDIAWADSEDNSRGVIAGALENGSLDLWDADKLLNGARYEWLVLGPLLEYKS
jgi:hypothetical protein